MSSFPLPTPTPTDKWTITTPTDYVVLGGVQIKVVKNFAATTTPVYTLNGPVGETIINSSAVATIWPGSITITDDGTDYFVEFNATISFFVTCLSGYTDILKQTVVVKGNLGQIGKVIPPAPTTITPPVLTPSGAGFTATTVFGAINIGAFNVDVFELKSIEVAINGGSSPIDPLI